MSSARTHPFSSKSAVALACLILAAVSFIFVQPSSAGGPVTFTVTTSVDAIDNNLADGVCSAFLNPRPQGGVTACTLRAAIMQANHNIENSVGPSGPYTIQLGNDVYELTLVNDGGHDDMSLRGDLDVLHGMTIQGNGPLSSVVDGARLNCETTDRVFHVLAPFQEPVLFNGFSIENGHAHGNVAKTPPFCGGINGGGGGRARPAGPGPVGNSQFGGGILNVSDLTLINMLVENNEAGQGGGGIFSTGALTVTGSQIHSNIVGICDNNSIGSKRSQGGFGNNHIGGGIGSTGALNINGGSDIIENEVRGRFADGSGPFRPSGSQQEIGALGGGVYHSKLGVMSDTDVQDNHAFLLGCQGNTRTRGNRSTGVQSSNGSAQGGGIYNNAVLTLTDVFVGDPNPNQKGSSANTAGRGGGIYNNAGNQLERPSGQPAVGVTMIDSTVQANVAGLTGGGVHNNGFFDSDNSDIIANDVFGIIFLKSGSPRASGISSQAGGGLFNEGDALIQNNSLVGDPNTSDLSFIGNSAFFGGGIFNDFNADLVVESSKIDGNLANQGGGIFNVGTGDVVDDSTVSFNLAESFRGPAKAPKGRAAGGSGTVGGGIWNDSPLIDQRPTGNGVAQFFIEESTLEGNVAESGGGIANDGSMHISKSTVHHNTAREEEQNGCGKCRTAPRAQGFPTAVGGGMLNSGFADVENSTFSGNTAENNGGGIHVDFGSLDMTHVTLADNSVDGPEEVSGAGFAPGGGLTDNSGDTSNFQATLFSNNQPANCQGNSGSLNSQGQNLADDDGQGNSCFLDDPGDFGVVPDALLGPLADNGGPTLTHLPASNSPAVDRITSECSLSDDQRSIARPQGLGCEVGAVEIGGSGNPSPSPPGPGPTPTPVPTGSPSPTPSPTPEPECPGYEGDPRNDVIGTPEPDVLDGTAFDDIICGFEGDDILRGFFGNDLLLAGPDDDRTLGGPGDDRIRNSTGNDHSLGGDGADEVRGGRGEDEIEGGDGDDLLRGYENDDSVSGGLGSDRVLGFPGDDDLDGGDGNDFVKGGLGDDDVNGGANNDNCNGGKGQDTIQNCEQGSPRAVADRRSGV